jgi:protein TIF31
LSNGLVRSTPIPTPDLGAKVDRDHADSTVALNSKLKTNVSEVSAEVQIADSEQATYALANNDLKGSKS